MNSLSPTPNERMTLLTAREAAEYLRLSLSTLHRLERSGRLAPLRTPGGHRRYTVEMLNECLIQARASLPQPGDRPPAESMPA